MFKLKFQKAKRFYIKKLLFQVKFKFKDFTETAISLRAMSGLKMANVNCRREALMTLSFRISRIYIIFIDIKLKKNYSLKTFYLYINKVLIIL